MKPNWLCTLPGVLWAVWNSSHTRAGWHPLCPLVTCMKLADYNSAYLSSRPLHERPVVHCMAWAVGDTWGARAGERTTFSVCAGKYRSLIQEAACLSLGVRWPPSLEQRTIFKAMHLGKNTCLNIHLRIARKQCPNCHKFQFPSTKYNVSHNCRKESHLQDLGRRSDSRIKLL